MLEIKNLFGYASENKKDDNVLKGLNLSINKGEIHVIMGPNGSGKSTLAKIIVGHPKYQISQGSVSYKKKDIKDWSIEKRACEGIFMAFQYPVEISGVNNAYFLKAAYNSIRRYHSKKEIDAFDFMKLIKNKMKEIDMNEQFLNRSFNESFSGGEKKRNEILQLSVLEPDFAILDEIDSGLDIDALKAVAGGINRYRSSEVSFLIITHYQRLLDYVVPDYVHVMYDGKIIKSGTKDLAFDLEKEGYQELIKKSRV